MKNLELPLPIDRDRKTRQHEDDADNPNREEDNVGTSKRPRVQGDLHGGESETTVGDETDKEGHETTVEELAKADKKDVESQLQSKSSILIPESSPTWRAHCRALFASRESQGSILI